MCNIAGYTGNKRAAPILIDMLRREQYIDGGMSTGIATIHDGKLYYTKVLGDVDVLLRETDALNFPGTVGIAHSRPGGNYVSHAHPFVDKDEKLAVVLNGTLRGVGTPEFFDAEHDAMQSFLDRGFPIRSAVPGTGFKPLSNGMGHHDTEVYALWTGDTVDSGSDVRTDVVRGLRDSMDTLPADIVILCIHALLEGTITVGKITRPAIVGIGDGESYVATTALAFPNDVTIRNTMPLPVCSVSQITPGAVKVTDAKFENVRIEEPTARMYAMAYKRLEALMIGQKDNPKSVYDFGFYNAWRDMWSQPLVDCKYSKAGDMLKPTACVMYETLEAFDREGRLHSVLGERNGKPITKFWLE